MQQIVLLFHVLIAFAIIALVLLQQGKGASMGSGFGGGASSTLFGSRGPASFLMKLTGFLVFLFFVTSLFMGFWLSHQSRMQNQLSAPVKQVQIASKTQDKATPSSSNQVVPPMPTSGSSKK